MGHSVQDRGRGAGIKGLGWKEPRVFKGNPRMGLGGRREVGWGQIMRDRGKGFGFSSLFIEYPSESIKQGVTSPNTCWAQSGNTTSCLHSNVHPVSRRSFVLNANWSEPCLAAGAHFHPTELRDGVSCLHLFPGAMGWNISKYQG